MLFVVTKVLSIAQSTVIALIWLRGTCLLNIMSVFEEFAKFMHDDDDDDDAENCADRTYTLAERC